MRCSGEPARGRQALVAVLTALACFAVPAAASAQEATAGVGLSDGAPSLTCIVYPLECCPVPNPGHALFERYQALAGDQTGGANSFQYTRAGIPWDAVSTGGAAPGPSRSPAMGETTSCC